MGSVGGEQEGVGKGSLRLSCDTSMLEEWEEFGLTFPLVGFPFLHLIVTKVEGSCVLQRLDDTLLTVFHRHIEQTVADFIDYGVRVFTNPAFREQIRMLGNETDNIVPTLLWGLETCHAIGTDNVFVTTDAATFIIQPYIRGITQAISSVEMITGILQYFLYADAVLIVMKGGPTLKSKVCLKCLYFTKNNP